MVAFNPEEYEDDPRVMFDLVDEVDYYKCTLCDYRFNKLFVSAQGLKKIYLPSQRS